MSAQGKEKVQDVEMGRKMGCRCGGNDATAASSAAIADVVEKMSVPFGTMWASGGDGSVPPRRNNTPSMTVLFTTSRGGSRSNVEDEVGSVGSLFLRKQVLGEEKRDAVGLS